MPPLIGVAVVVFAAVSAAPLTPSDNLTKCRDGLSGCVEKDLSPDERRLVAAVAGGRNYLACVEDRPTCEVMKLSTEQLARLKTVRDEREREKLKSGDVQAILTSARNFSACAYSKPECNPAILTDDQRATLSGIAEERAKLEEETNALQIREHEKQRRREAFKKFGVGLLNFVGEVAKAYVEVETQRAASADVTPVVVSSSPTVMNSSRVIESRIAGEFTGWSGETIFELANGQIWKQSSYAYKYRYAYRPKVLIYRSGSAYKMHVDGVQQSINVVRLK